MAIIKFSEKFINKFSGINDYIQTKYYKHLVYYVIDWRYRKSVKLTTWLKEQIEQPTEAISLLIEKIPKHKNDDYQMLFILRYIHNHFKYITDDKAWSVGEKWQTANTSAKLMHGDCEDGAILMYVIARLLNIKASKLLIFTGKVQGGGHAFLGYRPKNFPLNWSILDWCYYYNRNSINSRPLFDIQGRDFVEYKRGRNKIYTKINSKYHTLWFGFNENISLREIKLKK